MRKMQMRSGGTDMSALIECELIKGLRYWRQMNRTPTHLQTTTTTTIRTTTTNKKMMRRKRTPNPFEQNKIIQLYCWKK